MIQYIRTYSSIILYVLHLIGVITIVTLPESVYLTPAILLISALLLLLDEYRLVYRPLVFIIMLIGGYLIEVIGVNTGLLFGDYSYGDVLGFKLFEVPLLIGVNWIITVLASTALATRLFKGVKTFLLAIFAAVFATALDALIEPVAIKLGFWDWANAVVPFYNYICWFVFSFVFSLLYIQSGSKLNKTAVHLYFVWFLFFLSLNLVL